MGNYEVNQRVMNDLGAYLFALIGAFDKNDDHEKYIRINEVFGQMNLIRDRLDYLVTEIEEKRDGV